MTWAARNRNAESSLETYTFIHICKRVSIMYQPSLNNTGPVTKGIMAVASNLDPEKAEKHPLFECEEFLHTQSVRIVSHQHQD
jgi:hypothetical protein